MSRTLLLKLNTRPIRAITLALFLLSGIIFPNLARASFLNESFDYYGAGDLAGQGGWFLYDAQGMLYSGQLLATNWYNPPLALRLNSVSGGQGNVIEAQNYYATGSLSFWFYFSGNNLGGSDVGQFGLGESASTSGNINLNILCSEVPPVCDTANIRAYVGSWNTFFTGVKKETWNYFNIDFASPDNFRLTLNGDTTDWTSTPCSFNYIHSLYFWTAYFGTGSFNFWIDNIGGIAEIPPPPIPESCEDLELLERLVCEIKNTMAGAFLPSQDKINDLKNDLNIIQQKFPFNYLNEASTFFTDLKAGTEATSTISFKLLDKPGVVNFSIWEKSVNLAGSTQTFADILKGLFSGFVLFAFIVWAIGFGKRIFK